MERFFSLDHLSAERLLELYYDARKVGTLLIEYDKQGEAGHYDIDLPEDIILKNIGSENQNYIVFHEDFEDEPDCTTVSFGLTEHPFTRVYIDLDNSLLDRFAKEYGLNRWHHMMGEKRTYHPYSEFYTLEPMKGRNKN